MNKDRFLDEIKKLKIDVTQEQLNSLEKYCILLLEYNKHTNLTAIKEKESVYLKHFYDSLTIYKYIKNKSKVLDIGTGAGFPGMVLAIVNPTIDVTLLDSNNKKIKFLNYLIKELKLKNVTVVYDRAENFIKKNREIFDVVTSRAVASLRILCELALPFLKINGIFIAMKSNVDEEIKESLDTIEILSSNIIKRDHFLLPIENSHRENLIIQKKDSISLIYPREYDKIVKKPLVKKKNIR